MLYIAGGTGRVGETGLGDAGNARREPEPENGEQEWGHENGTGTCTRRQEARRGHVVTVYWFKWASPVCSMYCLSWDVVCPQWHCHTGHIILLLVVGQQQ